MLYSQINTQGISKIVFTPQVYHFNNGKDSLVLSQIFDPMLEYDNSTNYQYAPVEIIDSVDLNKDGRIEIIFLRKAYFSATPMKNGIPDFSYTWIVIGAKYYTHSRYEVWYLSVRKEMFGVTNMGNIQITTSTSFAVFTGYQFNVDIKRNSCFVLSDSQNYLG